MPHKDPKRYKEYMKEYREKHKKFNKENPWISLFYYIRYRCNNKKATSYSIYGGKGIKCRITKEELKELWFRDKAYEMERPSIDRLDSNKDYVFENCRFLELKKNSGRERRKPVIMKTLDGKFIREYESALSAERDTSIKVMGCHISGCCKGKDGMLTAGGYKWEYKKIN